MARLRFFIWLSVAGSGIKGRNGPQPVEVVTLEVIDAEIKRLEAELGVNDEEVEADVS